MTTDLTKTIGIALSILTTILGGASAWMNLNVRLGILETQQTHTTELLEEIKDGQKDIQRELRNRTR
jgi:hypothetical protein